jgi:hypothetical protein
VTQKKKKEVANESYKGFCWEKWPKVAIFLAFWKKSLK